MITATLKAPPVAKRNDIQVKIDADVFSEAKIVAAMRNQVLAEYLSEILRPIVHRDLEAEMSKRLSAMKPKKEKP
jgi:hypothetical protein